MIEKTNHPTNTDDFEICINPIAGRYPKLGLKKNGERYIIKFAAYKQNGIEVPYHVSEYAASKIMESLGYGVHEVRLATFRNRPGCLIKLFNKPLFTFGGLGTSTLSGENLPYDLDLLHSIHDDGKFEGALNDYLWDTFLLDAFVLNLDRHPNNWGFFKQNGTYSPAPLFDNGSSLYSLYAFELKKINNLDEHIKKFSTSRLGYKGDRLSFREVLKRESSAVFHARLELYIKRLQMLDLGFCFYVEDTWPAYSPYSSSFVTLLTGR